MNDNQLVQLLARGELSDRQIAERLGLSASQVSRIARGEKRPELQPRILAAMRETLKAAWKNGGRLATESGEPLPAATAKTAFDRHLAVELIASGQLTLSQIADRLGIHKSAAWRIMTGRTHPELQGLIREAQQHYRERARRLGCKWSAQIVMKQIEVGLKDNGWVGLRARQDLLDRFLGPEQDLACVASAKQADKPDAPRQPLLPIRSMTDLSPPLFAAVLKELGGADLTPDDYENYAAAHKDRTAVLKELGLPDRGLVDFEPYAAAHGYGPRPPDRGTDARIPRIPIRSLTDLSLPLKAAVLKELGGPDPDDDDPLFADCNDSSADSSRRSPKDEAGSPATDSSAVLEEVDGPGRSPEYWEAYAAAYEDSPFVRDPCAAAAAKAEASERAKRAAPKSPATAVAGKKREGSPPGGPQGPGDKSNGRDPPESRAGRRRVQSKTCP